VLRLLEDGSFLLATEGGEAKLGIRSVATGDVVLRAEATGAKALAAKLFLPEAAEAAAKEGIKLVDIQDIADPLALVVKELLRARRPELLARLFQELLPDAAVRSYSYAEYAGVFDKGIPSSASFSVEAVFAGDAAKHFEDVLELFSAIATKTSDLGMYTSLKSTSDPPLETTQSSARAENRPTQITTSNKAGNPASIRPAISSNSRVKA
jgi:hypothetical protein